MVKTLLQFAPGRLMNLYEHRHKYMNVSPKAALLTAVQQICGAMNFDDRAAATKVAMSIPDDDIPGDIQSAAEEIVAFACHGGKRPAWLRFQSH